MTHIPAVDEVVEEFDQLTNGDNVDGKGSYTEWLKNNPDKHLFEFEVYGEPMFDISPERVKDWLRTTLEARDKAWEEKVKTNTPPHVVFDLWCEDWEINHLSPALENLRKQLESLTPPTDK